MESDNHLCRKCETRTRRDRWTGDSVKAVPAHGMSGDFAFRVQGLLEFRDVVDNTKRQPGQLTVDHKLPMIRWTSKAQKEQTDYSNMSDDDIRDKFQLLRASNGSISHNLLKSRSCEKCFKTGIRGTPFGIKFFYEGDEKWSSNKKDPKGCVGCGWYDVDKWRKALNDTIKRRTGVVKARDRRKETPIKRTKQGR